MNQQSLIVQTVVAAAAATCVGVYPPPRRRTREGSSRRLEKLEGKTLQRHADTKMWVRMAPFPTHHRPPPPRRRRHGPALWVVCLNASRAYHTCTHRKSSLAHARLSSFGFFHACTVCPRVHRLPTRSTSRAFYLPRTPARWLQSARTPDVNKADLATLHPRQVHSDQDEYQSRQHSQVCFINVCSLFSAPPKERAQSNKQNVRRR